MFTGYRDLHKIISFIDFSLRRYSLVLRSGTSRPGHIPGSKSVDVNPDVRSTKLARYVMNDLKVLFINNSSFNENINVLKDNFELNAFFNSRRT